MEDSSSDIAGAVKDASHANLKRLAAPPVLAPAPKLTALPRVCPGMVIVQHMPENSPLHLPLASTACARSR